MGGSSSSRTNGRECCCFLVAVFFLLLAFVLAIVLGVTWTRKLPCSAESDEKVNFPKDWIRFYHLADVHYDPLYDPNVAAWPTYCRKYGNWAAAPYPSFHGRIGCDSPASLVQSAFQAMKSKDEMIDFIVVTGDYSGHSLFNDTVLNAIAFASDQLRKTFPKTYVFPCLGNNDVPADYYIPTPPTNWYEDVLTLWKKFILCSSCSWRSGVAPTTESSLNQTFLIGGYYRVSLSSKMTLLVLNTVYYSTSVLNEHRTSLFNKTANDQLTWLAEQLKITETEGKKAIIAGHIPPGINPFSLTDSWISDATQKYVDITARQYPQVIAGQLFAHDHQDDFKLFFVDQSSPSVQQSAMMLLTAAISPVYSNYPSFRKMFMDDKRQTITDYRQWYLDLTVADEYNETHWLEEYTFSQSYPSELGQVINSQRIFNLNQQLLNKTSDEVWHNYIWHRTAEYLPEAVSYSRFRLYCAIQTWNQSALSACKKAHPFLSG